VSFEKTGAASFEKTGFAGGGWAGKNELLPNNKVTHNRKVFEQRNPEMFISPSATMLSTLAGSRGQET
jgi:hypothetical protein